MPAKKHKTKSCFRLTLSEPSGGSRVGVGLLQRRTGEEVREDEGAKGVADGLRVGLGWDGNQLTKHGLKDKKKNMIINFALSYHLLW